MSKTRWSILSYLGAVSLLLGGLSACGDTGTAAPAFNMSSAAQSTAEQVAAVDDSECPEIADTVNIHSQADLDEFDSLNCFTVERHLFVQESDDIMDLSALHGLRSVGGYIGIADNSELMNAELPNLVKTGEGLVLEGNLSLQSISMPALRYVKGNLHVFDNQALQSASFGWLISVGEDVIFAGDNALTSLELPELTTIMGQFIFEHSDSLTCLCLPNLVAVNGDFTVHFNPSLKSVTAPSLTTIWGNVTIERNATLEVLDLSCLQWVAGDLKIIDNHLLAQCSVDATASSIEHIGGDTNLGGNQAICPDVPVTSEDVGCVDCTSNICAVRDVGDKPELKDDDEQIDEEPVDEEPVDEKPVDEEPIDEKPVDKSDDDQVDDGQVDDDQVDDDQVDDDQVDDDQVDDDQDDGGLGDDLTDLRSPL